MNERTKQVIRHMMELPDEASVPAGIEAIWDKMGHYSRRLGLPQGESMLPAIVALMQHTPAPMITVETAVETKPTIVVVPKVKPVGFNKSKTSKTIKGVAPGPSMGIEAWKAQEIGVEVAWFCFGGWKHGIFEGVNENDELVAYADGKSKVRKTKVVRLVLDPIGVTKDV